MSDLNQNRAFKEAVCIDAMRVFDSCSSQDCLEALELTFDETSQTSVDDAQYIKCKCIDVTGCTFAIDPVPFNRGFYTVDVNYTLRAEIEAYEAAGEPPAVVYGTTNAVKRVILFGSDGSTQRFMSNSTQAPALPSPTSGCASCCDNGTLPVAGISIATPMCLDAGLLDNDDGEKTVTVTVGIFAIIQLMRPVPILIPAYDYGVPESNCPTESDTPCELFAKIQFPTSEFFPQGLEADSSSCGCQTEEKKS